MGIEELNCFKVNKMYWRILGIYPDTSKNFGLSVYSKAFLVIFIFGYNFLYTVNFFFIPRQLDIFIEQMILYLTILVVLSKVMCFIFMEKKIIKLLTILESDLFKTDNEMERQILRKANKFNVKSWKIYAIVSYISNLTHVSSPLIIHFLFSVKLEPPVCGYDFLSDDLKQAFIYPIYFYQSIGMHFHMLNNVNVDTFLLGLMIFLIAQLDILQMKMKNITNQSPFLREGPSDARLGRETKELDKCILAELNKALIHYEDVTEYCYLIEEVFSKALFTQFSIASGIICVCLYRFTLPAPWQYYVFLTTYMAVMIVQILIPCWFGTRIMDKSTLVSQAIYQCDWTTQSRRFKSSMRLFMERAQRPLSINGWKMFLLSLNTFTSIMNSAYSFFTLLRHIQTRDD
ncbi:odorant receptor 46a-like [Zerene cesonia]|uniref:odorant receptor 46a-like n=1 Tax=Zerene cesonia TaxID=33412 RepID=UPI0018E54B47|nr:odorant receptor 46a-like [Zerene cesonia]